MKDDDNDNDDNNDNDEWDEAEEQDEYANKQFENINDDSFKIRVSCLKLIKNIINKYNFRINKLNQDFFNSLIEKVKLRVSDNVGEVQSSALDVFELIIVNKHNMCISIDFDEIVECIFRNINKETGMKELSKSL